MRLELSFASAKGCNRGKHNQLAILYRHSGACIEIAEAISGQVINHERLHPLDRVLVHLSNRVTKNRCLNFNAFGQTILIIDGSLRG